MLMLKDKSSKISDLRFHLKKTNKNKSELSSREIKFLL